MRRSIFGAAACFLCLCSILTADTPKPQDDDLFKAKLLGWQTAMQIVRSIEHGDQKGFPGTEAWLKELHEKTKGIDEKTPPEKWPPFDADALLTHNPRFWQMCYEIAPADPGMALLHAGLLMTGGEMKRAYHVLQIVGVRPNMPDELKQAFTLISGAAMQSGTQAKSLVQEGVKLHDQGDYRGAIKKYDEAIVAWPQFGWAYYEKGYSLFTKAEIDAGLQPRGDGALILPKDSKTDKDAVTKKIVQTPAIVEAYAKARQHDPFQVNAYQGADQEVIQGFLAMQKKILPAIKNLKGQPEIGVAYQNIKQLAEGFQEANQHELALLARQVMVSYRGRYEPSDHPFITTSLRKIAPGAETEATLKRLAGSGGIAFRQLVQIEFKQVYFPDKPAEEMEESKKVKIHHIQLLTDEKDIEARTKVEDLTKFIKAAEKAAVEILEKSDKPFELRIEFKCSPTGHKVELAVRKDPEQYQEYINKLDKELSKLEKLPVKEGTVEFQMFFEVKP